MSAVGISAQTEQEQWHIYLDALQRITEAPSEAALLQELVAALRRLYPTSSVRVFRYAPEADGLCLQAGQDEDGSETAGIGKTYPLHRLPHHRQALECGCVVRVDDTSSTQRLSDEEAQLFPPGVTCVVIAPFWLGTKDLGVISLGQRTGRDLCTSPLFTALLHHTAVAMDRLHQSARVKSAHAQFQALLEGTIAGTLILSADGRVVQANPAAASLLGINVDDLLGRSAFDIFGHQVTSLLTECDQNPTHTAPPREWHLSSPSHEGRELRVTARWLPSSDQQNGPRYLLSLLDISAQKRAEQLRERMIANVTHEMRTPIAIIRGYAELLQEMGDQVDATFRDQALNIIQERARDLLYMVESYIDLSSLESGVFSFSPEIVDLVNLVEMLMQERSGGPVNAPSLHINISPSARYIRCDPGLFAQIVRHLLDNALKFTPADGEVHVRAWAEGATLHLLISDTGTGIDSHDLPYVFDAFYRGQNAGFGVPGSGIGLALVRAAVHTMGGEVYVESEKGRKSTFHVVLPGVIITSSKITAHKHSS